MKQRLWQYILTGMIAGAVTGYLLAPAGLALLPADMAYQAGSWFALMGVIFLGLIGMVIIPLVVSSIILGINNSHDAGFVRRIGMMLVPYFLITSLITIFIGITLVEVIRPGEIMDRSSMGITTETAQVIAENAVGGRSLENLTIPDRIANMIPKNPLAAAMNLDLLQVVIAAILAGVAVLTLPRASMAGFIDVCNAVQSISMRIIEWAMVIAPVAVFGLIADMMIRLGPQAFIGLGWYVLTVLAGLALILVFYLLIVGLWARRSPWMFLKHCRAVMLLAFSTSSSAAVMPVTLATAEEKLGIHPDTARFVVPLGATINMDGTGMYQAVAAIFLCQFFGIDLTMGETFLLALTMVGASIGTPSTPGVGIVVLSTIVAGIGVPPEGIGMILGVDRILDMCRTTINVTGDLVASTVMQRILHTPA